MATMAKRVLAPIAARERSAAIVPVVFALAHGSGATDSARGPITRWGTGKILRRRTVAPLPWGRAKTTGTIAALRSRAAIGARTRFAIVASLHFWDARAPSEDSRENAGRANPLPAHAHLNP